MFLNYIYTLNKHPSLYDVQLAPNSEDQFQIQTIKTNRLVYLEYNESVYM